MKDLRGSKHNKINMADKMHLDRIDIESPTKEEAVYILSLLDEKGKST